MCSLKKKFTMTKIEFKLIDHIQKCYLNSFIIAKLIRTFGRLFDQLDSIQWMIYLYFQNGFNLEKSYYHQDLHIVHFFYLCLDIHAAFVCLSMQQLGHLKLTCNIAFYIQKTCMGNQPFHEELLFKLCLDYLRWIYSTSVITSFKI